VTSTIMELVVYPALFYVWRSRSIRLSAVSEERSI